MRQLDINYVNMYDYEFYKWHNMSVLAAFCAGLAADFLEYDIWYFFMLRLKINFHLSIFQSDPT